jgi:hypothetical protein
MALETADGKFRFADTPVGGRTLAELVSGCHARYSARMGWAGRPLAPGMYGYDAMAGSIGFALDAAKREGKSLVPEKMASLVHEGWAAVYVYWREHRPYETRAQYRRPAAPLGDTRRDGCAATPFDKLEPLERDKDLAVAEYLMEVLEACSAGIKM